MKRKKNEEMMKRREKLMGELSGLSGIVRGSLVETGKKCGRKECECSSGKLHPHRYLSTGTKGKNKVVYVSEKERNVFAQGVKAYEKAWKLICQISEINIRLIKEAGPNE
jgi:hypothetical protein